MKVPIAQTDLLTVEDVAALLKVSVRSVRKLRHHGLPLFDLPNTGRIYGLWPDIARWIEVRAKRCQRERGDHLTA